MGSGLNDTDNLNHNFALSRYFEYMSFNFPIFGFIIALQ